MLYNHLLNRGRDVVFQSRSGFVNSVKKRGIVNPIAQKAVPLGISLNAEAALFEAHRTGQILGTGPSEKQDYFIAHPISELGIAVTNVKDVLSKAVLPAGTSLQWFNDVECDDYRVKILQLRMFFGFDIRHAGENDVFGFVHHAREVKRDRHPALLGTSRCGVGEVCERDDQNRKRQRSENCQYDFVPPAELAGSSHHSLRSNDYFLSGPALLLQVTGIAISVICEIASYY